MAPETRTTAVSSLEIAAERVLLSDFDNWHIVLCNGLISDTEEEDVALEAFYEQLSDEEKIACKEKNWERVLDISPRNNGWMTRGEWVQATFWELRREDVRAVRFFRKISVPRFQNVSSGPGSTSISSIRISIVPSLLCTVRFDPRWIWSPSGSVQSSLVPIRFVLTLS